MLRPRQQDLLQFIIKFKEVNGYAPTIKEMANGLNTKSVFHIQCMIDELESLGYIKYQHGKQRTIVVLKFE